MNLTTEMRLQLLRALEANPDASQRDLAHALGISLGKVNYCLRALMRKGIIKARNFKNSRRKLAYMYQLTPAGVEEKSRLTVQFLRQKIQEVNKLKSEIEALRWEARRHAKR